MKSECYCRNIRRASNAVTELYDNKLKAVGLTVSQYSSLVNIDRLGSCSVSELSKTIGLERTTLVRTLKPMLERGFVKDSSEARERNRKLTLTQKGQELLEESKPLWQEAQQEFETKVGSQKAKWFLEVLEELQ